MQCTTAEANQPGQGSCTGLDGEATGSSKASDTTADGDRQDGFHLSDDVMIALIRREEQLALAQQLVFKFELGIKKRYLARIQCCLRQVRACQLEADY